MGPDEAPRLPPPPSVWWDDDSYVITLGSYVDARLIRWSVGVRNGALDWQAVDDG